MFSKIFPHQFEPEKEENAEETLDNVLSVPKNNGSNQESNPHQLDRVTRNNWCICNECHAIASTKIPEREGSISPSSSHEQLSE